MSINIIFPPSITHFTSLTALPLVYNSHFPPSITHSTSLTPLALILYITSPSLSPSPPLALHLCIYRQEITF